MAGTKAVQNEGFMANILDPLPGCTFAEDEQEGLQEQLFTSSWFHGKHLIMIHKILFEETTRFEFSLVNHHMSHGQKMKLERYLRNACPFNRPEKFCLRLHEGASESTLTPVTFEVRHNHILFSRHLHTECVPIIEVTKVPDGMLAPPFTAQKLDGLELFMAANSFWASPDMDEHGIQPEIKCSRDLLREALIWTASAGPSADERLRWFYELMSLDQECFVDRNEGTCVNIDTLRGAALSGHMHAVYRILQNLSDIEQDHFLAIVHKTKDWLIPTQSLHEILQELQPTTPWLKVPRELIAFEVETRERCDTLADMGKLYPSRRNLFQVRRYGPGMQSPETWWPKDFVARVKGAGMPFVDLVTPS